MKVGVLALQGAFAAHSSMLSSIDVACTEVRTADQLADLDALVLPGGESTTMSMLAERTGILEPLRAFVASGRPVLGTCAGVILLATEVLDGRDDQRSLGALDLAVRRNAFGRQLASFETDVHVRGLDGPPFHAVCIRAPAVERVGPDVEVLAEIDGRPALVRRGAIMGTIFHPELSGDPRVHEMFLGG
ncbi:MAG: pyridoxal 5'-phosphate synthase glutaminase subunit PdxT [Actinomycetes bacterium]